MGIRRGIPLIQRIQRGDDRSKTVHRSVRQWHADSPKELASKQRRIVAVAVDLAELQAKASTTAARLDKARADLAKVQAQASIDGSRVAKLEEHIKDDTALKRRPMAEAGSDLAPIVDDAADAPEQAPGNRLDLPGIAACMAPCGPLSPGPCRPCATPAAAASADWQQIGDKPRPRKSRLMAGSRKSLIDLVGARGFEPPTLCSQSISLLYLKAA